MRVDYNPKPYTPRLEGAPPPASDDGPVVAIQKPWLLRKEGELPHQHVHRLYHTCYHCGVYLEDMQALDIHENGHSRSDDS